MESLIDMKMLGNFCLFVPKRPNNKGQA